MQPARSRKDVRATVRSSGFTLVEIMVVLVIISIIVVALMITLFRPRIVANETSAIGSLKTIMTAQSQYAAANGSRYATLSELSSYTPPYIDTVIGGGRKSGFSFTMAIQNAGSNYVIHANPLVVGKTGSRRFFASDEGIIRFNLTRPAESWDPPID